MTTRKNVYSVESGESAADVTALKCTFPAGLNKLKGRQADSLSGDIQNIYQRNFNVTRCP